VILPVGEPTGEPQKTENTDVGRETVHTDRR